MLPKEIELLAEQGTACYLENKSVENWSSTRSKVEDAITNKCASVTIQPIPISLNGSKPDDVLKWHNSLGSAPLEKLKQICCITGSVDDGGVCLTCPVAKFCKLPFVVSTSYVESLFKLVHLDVCGPYRVSTRNN